MKKFRLSLTFLNGVFFNLFVAMNINLVTMKVDWSVHPDLLYLPISSYNVSITCGDKFSKAFMDLRQTSVNISYPTPFRTILTCIVDVRGVSSNKSDLLVGTSSFTTLGKTPNTL